MISFWPKYLHKVVNFWCCWSRKAWPQSAKLVSRLSGRSKAKALHILRVRSVNMRQLPNIYHLLCSSLYFSTSVKVLLLRFSWHVPILLFSGLMWGRFSISAWLAYFCVCYLKVMKQLHLLTQEINWFITRIWYQRKLGGTHRTICINPMVNVIVCIIQFMCKL